MPYFLDRYGRAFKPNGAGVLHVWGYNQHQPARAGPSTKAEWCRQQTAMMDELDRWLPWIIKRSKELQIKFERPSARGVLYPPFDFESAYDIVLLSAMVAINKSLCSEGGERMFGFIQMEAWARAIAEVKKRARAARQMGVVQELTEHVPILGGVEEQEAIEQKQIRIDNQEALLDDLMLSVPLLSWSMLEQHVLYGRSMTDIARDTGISKQAVSMRIKRAIASIRGNFSRP